MIALQDTSIERSDLAQADESRLSKVSGNAGEGYLSGLTSGIAAEVNALDQEFRALGRKTLEQMYHMGQIAVQMKTLLPKTNYKSWVKSVGDDSTLGAWANVAKQFDMTQIQSFVPSAARMLAAPSLPEAARREAIALSESGRVVDMKTAQQIRDRHAEERVKFDEVASLYKEAGYSFERTTIRKRPYVANAVGIQQLFRGLEEAFKSLPWMRQRLVEQSDSRLPSCHSCKHRINGDEGWSCGAKSEDAHTYSNETDVARESGCRLYVRQVYGSLREFRAPAPVEGVTPAPVEDVISGSSQVENAPTETSRPERLERVANDFYPTRDSAILVKALKQAVDIQGQVFSCCAGDGEIAGQFEGAIANDLHEYPGFQADFYLDATQEESWQEFDASGGFDWVVENPTFRLASTILPLAFDHARVGCAFLLRLSYMEPCDDRAKWLEEHADQMVALIPVNPRPRFRADTTGTDPVTVAWLIWRKDWSWKKLGITCPFQFLSEWRGNGGN